MSKTIKPHKEIIEGLTNFLSKPVNLNGILATGGYSVAGVAKVNDVDASISVTKESVDANVIVKYTDTNSVDETVYLERKHNKWSIRF